MGWKTKATMRHRFWQSDLDISHFSEEGVTIMFSSQDRMVLTEKWEGRMSPMYLSR